MNKNPKLLAPSLAMCLNGTRIFQRNETLERPVTPSFSGQQIGRSFTRSAFAYFPLLSPTPDLSHDPHFQPLDFLPTIRLQSYLKISIKSTQTTPTVAKAQRTRSGSFTCSSLQPPGPMVLTVSPASPRTLPVNLQHQCQSFTTNFYCSSDNFVSTTCICFSTSPRLRVP